MTGFQLSPDGKHLVALRSVGDARSIVVWDTAKMSARPTVIDARDVQFGRVSFLKNDMLQVVTTQPYEDRGNGVPKTFLNKLAFMDLEGKAGFEPMAPIGSQQVDPGYNPTVLSRLVTDPDNVIMLNRDRGSYSQSIFRYNVHTHSATRLMHLSDTDEMVWISPTGQPWAKKRGDTDSTGAFEAIDFREKDGEWREHFRSYVKTRDVVDVVAVGSMPGTAVIQSNVGREFAGLYEYDIATRKTTSTLLEHKYFDADGVRSLNLDGTPGKDGYDGFTFQGQQGEDDLWVDPKITGVLRGVGQALGIKEINQELVGVGNGAKASIRSFDGVTVRMLQYAGGEVPTYLIRVTGITYPTEYYLMRGSNLQLLAKEFPTVDKRALGSAKVVYYPARDGLNIPAYLTTPNPALCGPGPYSAVIHPHGGPWARDEMDYDESPGWIPLMVSRCHVVLQPQYRGSTGWGRTLWFAGDKEWGGKMQDDKDDAVKWLVAQKLVDPKRVAMFGFSYGGYAAFAASVRPNGLYKCAIAGAGVTDIDRIWAGFYSNPFYKEKQEPTVRGLSPLSLADKVQIPLMVYGGDRDTTVPVIQSETFVDKAKSAGKPVEFHLLTDYSHGQAWKRATEVEHLTLINDYFTKGCGGGGL